MNIRQLVIKNFRGFVDLIIKPNGHVVLLGEPGAGRSDILHALSRVLDSNTIRSLSSTELDFYNKDIGKNIEIEVTLGALGSDIEQDFFDHLEIWDLVSDQLLEESTTSDDALGQDQVWVLRLKYQCQWLSEQERCDEFVYYPKDYISDSGEFPRVKLSDIERLKFIRLNYDSGKILDLGTRGSFRKIIEHSAGGDFAVAIAQYVQEVSNAAAKFTTFNQVKNALDDLITPLHDILGVEEGDINNIIGFSPEGGSPSGLLRSLAPSIDLGDEAGALPAWRRGSTISTFFRIAESLALSEKGQNIIAIDDLGDGLDPASAAHFSQVIRNNAGQAWITTRAASVAELFRPEEIVRLGHATDGTRQVWLGHKPTSKSEAVAAKHWLKNLLPVLCYRTVIIVEGPKDIAAFHALAIHLSNESARLLPAVYGIAFVSAGATGAGGYANVIKLAIAARNMGLHTVGIIDGDMAAESKQFLVEHANDIDAAIRLPDNTAIELALVNGMDDDILRQVLVDISTAATWVPTPDLSGYSGKRLISLAIDLIKKHDLHAAFIDAIPSDHLPQLAVTIFDRAVLAARKREVGVIQL